MLLFLLLKNDSLLETFSRTVAVSLFSLLSLRPLPPNAEDRLTGAEVVVDDTEGCDDTVLRRLTRDFSLRFWDVGRSTSKLARVSSMSPWLAGLMPLGPKQPH